MKSCCLIVLMFLCCSSFAQGIAFHQETDVNQFLNGKSFDKDGGTEKLTFLDANGRLEVRTDVTPSYHAAPITVIGLNLAYLEIIPGYRPRIN